ncbi:MAG: IPTL-CTERM sorting domain-containing protein [Planctomycetes bacterium]|nr:IPTL-CTERM sorting domain-containing protein [Planctomycetota bacterium]MBI3833105.1 IPTL-CTERM sorting domain-containing protein [Planctomycetota bacterium]
MCTSCSIRQVLVSGSLLAILANASVAHAQPIVTLNEEAVVRWTDTSYAPFFGEAVGLSGDVAFVGAPNYHAGAENYGAVFMYQRSGAAWMPAGILAAQGPDVNISFGASIAISGDWMVVGASELTSSGYPGRVHFFHHEGGTWVWTQVVSVPVGNDSLEFGASVAIDGNTAVVGIGFGPSADAFIFTLTGNVWSLDTVLSPGLPDAYCRVAESVGINADRIVVGSPCEFLARVYYRSAGSWRLGQTLTESPAIPYNSFGHTVAIEGETLMVAAGLDEPGGLQSGRVHSYTFNGTTWLETQLLAPPDGEVADIFGGAIALKGDSCLIGANGASGLEAFDGAGYLYRRCDGVWVEERKLLSSQPQYSDYLGASVALDGQRAILGGPGPGGQAAFIFDVNLDCNGNQLFDACDVFSGASVDCNGNHMPDECEPQADCNGNGIQDICDIASGHSNDCNSDFVPDECELVPDCNSNGVPDRCDIAARMSKDCQRNGIPDECDIASGVSLDTNHNGIPDECEQPACVPDCIGPCVSLKAVAVNNAPMPSSNCVWARPGDIVTSEFFLSNWNEAMAAGLRGYQISIYAFNGGLGGTNGQLIPLGYDRPVPDVSCSSASDCPSDFPVCPFFHLCQDPARDPAQGQFIDLENPDFVFSGLTALQAVSPGAPNIRTRYAALPFEIVGVADDGLHRYGATLKLVASDNACGTFTFPVEQDQNTKFIGPSEQDMSIYPNTQPLIVHVCEDDGIYCNGLESCDAQAGCVIQTVNCDDGVTCTVDKCNEAARGCDHTPSDALCEDGNRCTLDQCTPTGCSHLNLCGACCNQTTGACTSSQLAGECTCAHCHWTQGASCVEANCTQVFTPIPTVSHWGLAVLSLLLAIGAKLRFSRREQSGC